MQQQPAVSELTQEQRIQMMQQIQQQQQQQQYSASVQQQPMPSYTAALPSQNGGMSYANNYPAVSQSQQQQTSIGYRSLSNQESLDAGLAGVGIFFQQNPTTLDVFVRTVVSGGSAHRSGQVQQEDIVVSVDGDTVRGKPLDVLRDKILGVPGSFVKLTFNRKGSAGESTFDVELMRGSPRYLDSIAAAQQPQVQQPSAVDSEVTEAQIPSLARRSFQSDIPLQGQEQSGAAASAMAEANSRLRRRIDELEAKAAQLESDNTALKERLQSQQRTISTAEDMAARYQQQANDLENTMQQRLKDAEARHMQELEDVRQRASDETNRSLERCKLLQADLDRERAQSSTAQQREEQLCGEIERLQVDAQSRRRQHDAVVNLLENERSRLRQVAQSLDEVSKQLHHTDPSLQEVQLALNRNAPSSNGYTGSPSPKPGRASRPASAAEPYAQTFQLASAAQAQVDLKILEAAKSSIQEYEVNAGSSAQDVYNVREPEVPVSDVGTAARGPGASISPLPPTQSYTADAPQAQAPVSPDEGKSVAAKAQAFETGAVSQQGITHASPSMSVVVSRPSDELMQHLGPLDGDQDALFLA